MLGITQNLIRATVTEAAYNAAEAYAREGRVREWSTDVAAKRISGKVQGTARRPYSQVIDVRAAGNGTPVILGQCSCPVGLNCKHIAAVLLQVAASAEPVSAKPAARDWREIAKANQRALAPQPAQAPAPEAAAPAMNPALAAWLQELATDLAADSEEYPTGVYKRLFYMLTQAAALGARAPILAITAAAADVRRDGTISQTHSTPDVRQLTHGQITPKYLRPSDRAIIASITGGRLDASHGDPVVALRRIIATGRARLGAFPGVLAHEGQPRDGKLDWRLEPDGTQIPHLAVSGGGQPVLLPVPWFLDETTGEVGELNVGVSPLLLLRLLNAPPVPPGQVAALREALATKLPKVSLPAPRELPHGGRLSGPPVPHVSLRPIAKPDHYDANNCFAGAELSLAFRYGEVLLPVGHADIEVVHDGVRYDLARDRAWETAAHAALAECGFVSLRTAMPWGSVPADQHRLVLNGNNAVEQWLTFMLEHLPALQAQGWEVDETDDFPHRLIAPSGPLQAELRPSSGMDWFDLDMGVLVGDERVDLAPALIRLISNPQNHADLRAGSDGGKPGRKLLLNLPDGRRLALDYADIRPMLLTLLDLFGGGIAADEGKLSVTRQGAAAVAALEQAGLAAGLVWRGGDALRALGRQLRDRGGITEAVIPAWFTASLRPYQQRGVDWLQFLREAGLAGVLADDMGLGKTVQTLAHIAVEKQEGRLTEPALVICPTSVVNNWVREAERFAPQLRVLPLQGADRKTRFAEIPSSDLVISTYPLLTRDEEILVGQPWHTVILDEAQTVKNPGAIMAQIARQLRSGQRLCLTGTPMENHLGELWSLFDFMMPGFLGTQSDFTRRFRTPVEKNGDMEVHAALARRVAPFLLRRTKAQVASDLPPRTDIVENIEMQPPQRAIYEAIRLAMHAKVQDAIAEQGLAKSGIVILDALLKLRQACCDPRLLKIPGTAKHKSGSAKLERLIELMQTLLEEGRSILLFSQFTSMLALIEEAIKPLGIEYVTLTGDTKDRRTPVDDFQAGKVKLFLISLKAGGVGLNLTAADTVIHYDPWWNPAVENQATDRAHRIGQTRSVFVHRLITENTIEEKMELLKGRKSALAEGILTGAGANALRMTEDDVEMLFS
jgi:superfamily II DNA or RNA helicase